MQRQKDGRLRRARLESIYAKDHRMTCSRHPCLGLQLSQFNVDAQLRLELVALLFAFLGQPSQ